MRAAIATRLTGKLAEICVSKSARSLCGRGSAAMAVLAQGLT